MESLISALDIFSMRSGIPSITGRRLKRHTVVIAESDLNDVRVINSSSKGGYGFGRSME